MRKEIIINSAINEVRAAITEDGKLAEFFIELPNKERIIGNIYLGRVNKVVPGINAAFINIGLNQDAFLHFSDVDDSLENYLTDEDDDESLDESEPEESEDETTMEEVAAGADSKEIPANGNNRNNDKSKGNLPTFRTKKSGNVQINLQEGQTVVVQVTREAFANKGVKVTTKIALPGRYLVLMPYDQIIGVSRKIGSYSERRRLRTIMKSTVTDGYGCIIRTAARSKTDNELAKDWEYLIDKWREIDNKIKKMSTPGLAYQDMQLATSLVRDLFTTQVQRVIVDSKKLYKEIINYVRRVSPHLENKIEHYSGGRHVFEEFGIDKELQKTYKKRINLVSGGYLVIEQTEAMTVIDVNSGRSTETEQEATAFKTNVEAGKEIARQIRLRDLGGMIIVDFIDMTKDANKKRLFYEMKREMGRDRAKTVVYPLTQLGLLQITRQRINQNIVEKITETCPLCKGTGRVTSKAVLINEIDRWLKNFRQHSREFRLVLQVNPGVAEYITDGTFSTLSRMMIKHFVRIKILQNETISIDQFKFFSVRQNKDITQDYL